VLFFRAPGPPPAPVPADGPRIAIPTRDHGGRAPHAAWSARAHVRPEQEGLVSIFSSNLTSFVRDFATTELSRFVNQAVPLIPPVSIDQ
jgi:hypothetical protein